MRLRESRRMEGVQQPVIPTVADWIRQHPGAISLGQGVVHYGPPPQALEAIARFHADPENHKYRPVQGIPSLMQAIERKLAEENEIPCGGDSHVVVTAGGNMAFQAAILAICDPCDEVILQRPCYFNHEMAVEIAGCRPVLADCDARFQLQPEAVREVITPRTRAVVTVSPNNPSGAVYPEQTLTEVNRLCAERGLFHIHDEAYEHFTWDGARHFSPGSLPDAGRHTISLFSLSKSYGFASWRIGYGVYPAQLLPAVRKIQDTVLICAPAISQFAAVGALEAGPGYCRERLEGIGRSRALMLDGLASLGDLCEVPAADGAFYLLPRIRSALDPLALVERLIREHGVAAIPGAAFGIEDGCTLRVAYGALTEENAAEGIARLTAGLESLGSDG